MAGVYKSMTISKPDNWVILKIDGNKASPFYKVLAGWSGGYLDGNSWRMNSGIVRHELKDNYWYFYGQSGSCYQCHVDSYQLRMNNTGIYNQLKEKHGDIVNMIEDNEWTADDWNWGI